MWGEGQRFAESAENDVERCLKSVDAIWKRRIVAGNNKGKSAGKELKHFFLPTVHRQREPPTIFWSMVGGGGVLATRSRSRFGRERC